MRVWKVTKVIAKVIRFACTEARESYAKLKSFIITINAWIYQFISCIYCKKVTDLFFQKLNSSFNMDQFNILCQRISLTWCYLTSHSRTVSAQSTDKLIFQSDSFVQMFFIPPLELAVMCNATSPSASLCLWRDNWKTDSRSCLTFSRWQNTKSLFVWICCRTRPPKKIITLV